MEQRIKEYWGEGMRELWTAALLPTLQARWKSIGAWTLMLAVGIPYAWFGFHRAMAPVFEAFLTYPPETQQQMIQGLYATPPPLWATLSVNVAVIFGFVWCFRALLAPFKLERLQGQGRAAFRSEPQPKEGR